MKDLIKDLKKYVVEDDYPTSTISNILFWYGRGYDVIQDALINNIAAKIRMRTYIEKPPNEQSVFPRGEVQKMKKELAINSRIWCHPANHYQLDRWESRSSDTRSRLSAIRLQALCYIQDMDVPFIMSSISQKSNPCYPPSRFMMSVKAFKCQTINHPEVEGFLGWLWYQWRPSQIHDKLLNG